MFFEEFLWRGRDPSTTSVPSGYHVRLAEWQEYPNGKAYVIRTDPLNMTQMSEMGYDLPDALAEINSDLLLSLDAANAIIAQQAALIAEQSELIAEYTGQGVNQSV